jgi:hypothetical protein
MPYSSSQRGEGGPLGPDGVAGSPKFNTELPTKAVSIKTA